MSRRIAIVSVLGLLATGFGCRHIGGKCDCQANPADGVPLPLTNPYPSAPVPGFAPSPAIPPAAGKTAFPAPMPPTTLPN